MIENFKKTNQLVARAKKVTPLAAQTFSKSYRYFIEGNAPMFIERGEGCYVFDVDGNQYIDFICALGPITVGYNNKVINDAVIRQLEKGPIFSTQTAVELELAEKLCTLVPCAEMVRLVKNGSDATTAAIRLARAFTGREMVAKCGYHGMHDWSIGASPNNRGVPKCVCELTKDFKYNDIADLKLILQQHPNQFAAVIMEPIQANGTTKEYLNEVEKLTHKHGALLIFDEVVSGFRYALGGASEYYGVKPDLAAFGKGMGNGLAISAVAGRADVMSLIEQGVFVSTTFGGDAIAAAGALATIQELEKPGTYEHFWKMGSIIEQGIRNGIKKYELGKVVSFSGFGPHCGVAFESVGKLSYLDINSVYSYYMIEQGILTLAINNINKAHTEKEMLRFNSALDIAFAKIAEAVKQDTLDGIIPKQLRVDPVFKRNIL